MTIDISDSYDAEMLRAKCVWQVYFVSALVLRRDNWNSAVYYGAAKFRIFNSTVPEQRKILLFYEGAPRRGYNGIRRNIITSKSDFK